MGDRRRQLDALRGGAALAVVAFHVTLYTVTPGGLGYLYAKQLWIAVPVFFALSGYLIRAQVETDTDRFLARRLGRIVPLWLVVGAATWGWYGCNPIALLAPSLWIVAGADLPGGSGVLWSVSVEAAWYCWVALAWRSAAGPRLLLALLALKCALAAVSFDAVYFLGQADGLVWGWLAWSWRGRSAPLWLTVGVGMAGFVAGPFVALASPAAACLVVSTAAGIGGAGLVALGARGELVTLGPLEVVGRYSYGVYVLHIPAWLVTGDVVAAAALTAAASWVSFRGLERPAARALLRATATPAALRPSRLAP